MDRQRFRTNHQDQTPQAAPVPAQSETVPAVRRSSRRIPKWLIVFVSFMIIAALAAGIIWLKRPADPIPASTRAAALFPLYYPARYPKGYSLDKASFQYVNQVVTFTLTSSSAKIFISEQATPQGFDFDNFNQQLLANPKGILTPYGKAVIGTAQDSKVTSLVIGKTWVLMSTNPNASDKTLEDLADHLKPSAD
jgi:hypothetical protein